MMEEMEESPEDATLAECLKRLLANQISMFLMAQGFHWNVEGRDFSMFHSFFGAIYEDVYGSIDPTAENIRKLGEYAPFNVPTLDRLREIPDAKVSSDPISMCDVLLNANDVVLEDIDEAIKCAVRENEQGIANFLAERDDQHKKWRWQLQATVK